MPHLSRFRIVRLPDELQTEMGLPEFICADPEGMPFPEGRRFYDWLINENGCEPITAYNYLNTLLSFFTYLQARTPPLEYIAPAEQIRHQVRDYLKGKLGCVVRPHGGGNFVVKASKTMTAPSVRLFLTALKRFYTCAIVQGWYPDSNPLVWATGLAAAARDFKPVMPPWSGLTRSAEKAGRMPDTYFCVVSGDWQPQIVDDPNLPKRLLAAFTQPRDQLIARILFESGARISEVLGLRVGDWQCRDQRERALAANKGSRGQRVKEIWWSSATAQLLRNYVNQDRRRCDVKARGLDELSNTAPLFVTDEGEVYTYAAFYANWQKACKKAGLKVTPHQARHWFVTLALHKFESLSEDQREAARHSLIAYMGWKNPETIRAYDHHIRQLEFAPTHAALSRLVEAGDSDPVTNPSQIAFQTKGNAIPKELWERVSQWVDDQPERR
jgi:integrase